MMWMRFVRIAGFILAFQLPGLPVFAADWPQWRGPDRTGVVPAGGPGPTNLPATPKVLWRLTIGGGFSSPVVAAGKLVYLDAQDGRETAHALDARSGQELWRAAYDEAFGDEWGPGQGVWLAWS